MNESVLKDIYNYDSIILYGLGAFGRRAYFDLKDYSGAILCAVTHARDGQEFYGHKVHDIDYYLIDHSDIPVVVTVKKELRDGMGDYATRLGFEKVIVPDIRLDDYDYLSRWETLDLERVISEWYESYTGKKIDIKHPVTFNEKIQWMKLYDNSPLKTQCSDKWAVREYVKNSIGEKYLIPVYGVWNSFDEVDFDILPDRFALKCTHASGTNEIVTSKQDIDLNGLKIRFDEWMGRNYAFMCGLELNYKDIVPRVYAEKYLSTEDGVDLRDYKVHVFDGKAKVIQVDIDRSHVHRRNMYSPDWEYIPCSILYPTAHDVIIDRPGCLDELIRVSEKLSEGFIYVRCDFYIIDDDIYFGEMTFAHGSGVEPFDPESYNKEMGEWIHLPIDGELKNE